MNHIKKGAVPLAQHTHIPVPLHWKAQVKAAPAPNVTKGTIKPVPIVTPTTSCSQMVVTTKKDSTPRQKVDLQHLNNHVNLPSNWHPRCHRTVDGYHAIALDKESQLLTIFITEWETICIYVYPKVF